VAFAAALVSGVTVQVVGAFAYDVVAWNNRSFVAVKVGQNEPLLFADPDQASREAWARHGSCSVGVTVVADAPGALEVTATGVAN
jgi:hypothetical protein